MGGAFFFLRFSLFLPCSLFAITVSFRKKTGRRPDYITLININAARNGFAIIKIFAVAIPRSSTKRAIYNRGYYIIARMTSKAFEIRICRGCGLRYPLAEGHAFGARCPVCLGETRVVMGYAAADAEPRGKRRAKISGRGNFSVMLDNIRSAWNVGSILRSADGFGFSRAYLCGITPTPESEAVRKTALGAEEYVKWSYHKDAVKLARRLKKQDWQIFALEEDTRSQPLAPANARARVALILGSEVTGVDPELLDLADQILHIPMRGQKRSFNVANAFSIAAYALTLAQ